MFTALGVLLAIYIAHCLLTGAVYAKAGAWGRTYTRAEHPPQYWGAIASYTVLAFALGFLF